MIGDFVADLNAIAGASQSGSIGQWLTTQLADFRRLPGSVSMLRAQIDRVNAVLARDGAQGTGAGQAVRDAATLTERITARYPSVSARVDQVTAAIAPVLPKLYTGTYDAEVVGALLTSGTDIIGTVRQVSGLLATRDEAQQLLQDAVNNPSLPAATRESAWAALTSAGAGNWLKIGAGLLMGYVIIRAVMK